MLAPEIALELVYSDELAAALTPFDPAVSERMVRASLVQQINRLSLLRLDQRGDRIARGERVPPGLAVDRSPGGQVLIHRLLQHVVRSRMTEAELTEARHQVHLVLGAARPDGEVDDPETWQRFRILWPHLEPSNAVECSDESVRRLIGHMVTDLISETRRRVDALRPSSAADVRHAGQPVAPARGGRAAAHGLTALTAGIAPSGRVPRDRRSCCAVQDP